MTKIFFQKQNESDSKKGIVASLNGILKDKGKDIDDLTKEKDNTMGRLNIGREKDYKKESQKQMMS